MNATQVFLVKAARDRLVAMEDHDLDELTDIEMAHYMFASFRDNPLYGHGMRLTGAGLDLLRECFTVYEVDLSEPWGMTHLVMLDRFFSLPYYIDRSHMVLFDEELALQLIVNGGNLTQLLQAKVTFSSM